MVTPEFTLSKTLVGFPGRASPEDVRDAGWVPGGERGSPPLHSCLGNPTGREAWGATVQAVAKSQTQRKRPSPHAQPWYAGEAVPVS